MAAPEQDIHSIAVGFPSVRQTAPRVGIAVKVGIGLASITIIVSALAALFFLQSISEAAESNHRDKARLLVQVLEADAPRSGIVSIGRLQDLLDSLRETNPEVIRINIYQVNENEGRVVASTDHARIGTVAEPYDLKPLATQKFTYQREMEAGQPITEIIAPLVSQGRPVATVGLYLSRQEVELNKSRSVAAFGAVGLISLSLVLGLHWLVWQRLMGRRLATIRQACASLAQGDYSHRIGAASAPGGQDELEVLARSFDLMSQRIEEQQRQLELLATLDGLTGIFNRRALIQKLDDEIQRAARYGHPLSLLMLDVDDFKEVNDTYGHLVGDQVLKEFVEKALKPSLRKTDILARYGGDEFVAILPDTPGDSAREVWRRLSAQLEEALVLPSGTALPVGASCGIASFPEDGGTAEDILRMADARMYQDKLM